MWGSVAFGLVFPLQADSNSNGAHSQTSFFLGLRSLYKGSSFIFQSGKVCGAQADGTAFPGVPHKETARSGRAGTNTHSIYLSSQASGDSQHRQGQGLLLLHMNDEQGTDCTDCIMGRGLGTLKERLYYTTA